jgi:hypothetical protein
MPPQITRKVSKLWVPSFGVVSAHAKLSESYTATAFDGLQMKQSNSGPW